MPENRTVRSLLYAEQIDMGGLPVRQPFPTHKVDQIDPFLLLHHAKTTIPEGAIPHKSGVGPHPHRGFAAVTFIFKGGVHHRDSRGNDSTVYEGGTQWMNTNMGIVHSERPPKDIFDRGGVQEIIQLWINIPQKHKMDQPAYFALNKEDTPEVQTNDDKIKIKVVAGDFEGVKGKIKTYSSLIALRLELKKDAEYFFPVPHDFNTFIYLLDGKLKLEGFGMVDGLNLVYFNNDGEGITIKVLEDTRAILLAGEPLDEPVARHGPFVMNTQTEVLQAMRDYQMGKMGILIED